MSIRTCLLIASFTALSAASAFAINASGISDVKAKPVAATTTVTSTSDTVRPNLLQTQVAHPLTEGHPPIQTPPTCPNAPFAKINNVATFPVSAPLPTAHGFACFGTTPASALNHQTALLHTGACTNADFNVSKTPQSWCW